MGFVKGRKVLFAKKKPTKNSPQSFAALPFWYLLRVFVYLAKNDSITRGNMRGGLPNITMLLNKKLFNFTQ